MRTHKWSEIEARMDPERRKRIEERAKQMLAEMPLEELRAARQLTQVQMAKLMQTTQGSVSKIERRTDMYVSTLASFIEAMGGKLEIRAVFPDGEVRINQFQDIG
ncbi:MAG TPA: XRE family transcriptional regulator [Bryobacteraceae bacterium]|nr:XRE family transcriptional regulator [Bryobacteraceae bacterium]